MTNRLRLADIVNDPLSFKYSDALYMAPGAAFEPGSFALVHDVDDVEGDTDLPLAALDLGYDYVLGMQAVQSIVENATRQRSNATTDDLLDALSYYYDNDSFIDLSD